MAIQSLRFDCEIITPMFIGNAIPGKAELRVPSLKGALRFWWRALHSSLPLADVTDEKGKVTHKGLRTLESEIFGSADGSIGRSKIQFTIEGDLSSVNGPFSPNPTFKRLIKKGNGRGLLSDIKILEYLAYGVVDGKKGYHDYFPVGEKFVVEVRFDDEKITREAITDCLYLISVFGGLGAKARNGFGRFVINGLPAMDITALIRKLKAGEMSAFTSFSKNSCLFTNNQIEVDPIAVLTSLGKAYLFSRVNYHNGNVIVEGGLENEHRFQLRPFIAAPIVEGKKLHLPMYNGRDVESMQRHSKSYFLGIAQIAGKYQGYMLHLPYQYLAGSEHELQLLPRNILTLQQAYAQACSLFNQKLTAKGFNKIV